MLPFFATFISLLIIQRLVELFWARRNYRSMMAAGGYEVGASHYPLVVGVHLLFFTLLVFEVLAGQRPLPSWWPIPAAVFMMAQVMRAWCLIALGKFWNTRIVVLPGAVPVTNGPYRWIRHPNYLVVCIELLTVPLMFGAYFTACLISLLNAGVMIIRIRAEERALAPMDYEAVMGKVSRFLPLKTKKIF